MIDWDDYRLILALYRSGTLRGAAAELGVNHSTVSRRLAALDRRQGAQGKHIFEREAGRYSATDLGERLVSIAETMEASALAGERHRRASPQDISGRITLSIPEAIGQFLLLEELHDFARQHPAIDLIVDSTYRLVNLDRSEADVVIRSTQSPPDHLVGRRLFPYYLACYASRDYLASTAASDLNWIITLHDGDSIRPDWLATSPYPDAPVSITVGDITARHHALIAGHGLVRSACYMADRDPRLVRLPGKPISSNADIWILTHPDLRDTPRIQTLMRFLTAAMLEKRDLIEGRRPQPT